MRIEKDFLGIVEIPNDTLYGIHSYRARENFPNESKFHLEWYMSIANVKLAMYYTYKKFKEAAKNKYDIKKISIEFIDDNILDAMIEATIECTKGQHYDDFIVPAITGGAGTSQNMNVNEIIANRANQILGFKSGDYDKVHPIEQANIYQSTNDVIPTALKAATMQLLEELENSINSLRNKVEKLERKYSSVLRIAYTQMQEAVPSTYGRLFSAYSEALSRDWWRVSKCFERIKQVNLGGSAVGTGITVPRYFIMESVGELRRLTNQPLTRAENLTDATQNIDSFVEIHGIIKSHSVNMEKITKDIRLLASDLRNDDKITIPQLQAGSSIMPGKINPVIPEYVVSVANKVYANDMLITNLSAQGCLDLNAYLPIIGEAVLESLKLLISIDKVVLEKLLNGLEIDTQHSEKRLFSSPAIATALLPYIGYEKAGLLAKEMKNNGVDIYSANKLLNIVSEDKLSKILKSDNLLKEGFSINDLL